MSTFRGFRLQAIALVQRTPCMRVAQPQPAHFLLRIRIPSRAFQTALRFRAAAKPSTLRATAATPIATKTNPARIGSYAEQLAAKGTRTALYEAPSHFWLTASSFGAAAFCVSYSVYHYWATILYPPEGMAWWVPHGFAVICIFMAGMATYFVSGATRIVRSIEAVPASLVKLSKGTKASAAKTPLYIEVAVRRVVPFMAPKKILALPEEVKMPFRMNSIFQGASPLSVKDQIKAARAELERREAARQHQMDHIMTAPFRDAGRGLSGAWMGIRRALTKEGFASLKVKKTSYKLDISNCWALDNGRSLDRLVAVRPNEMRDTK